MKIIRYLFAALLVVAFSARAERYVEIAGEIELTTSQKADSPAPIPTIVKTNHFVCITGANEWQIENDFFANAELKCHYDGTNICQSLRTINALSAQTDGEKAKSRVTINVWSSADGQPFGETGVNIPWLAFCSGSYLKRPDRLVPLPIGPSLRMSADRLAYTDKTTNFSDELALPKGLELFSSRALFEASQKGLDAENFSKQNHATHTKNVLKTLQDGDLVFHYSVVESTNFQGWQLPTHFEFFQNPRKTERGANIYYRGVGRVKSIREGSKPDGVFTTSAKQYIVDWRFRDEENKLWGLNYESTNAFLQPVNTPTLKAKFDAQIESAVQKRQKN